MPEDCKTSDLFKKVIAESKAQKKPLFHANVNGEKQHSYDGRTWYKEDGSIWVIPEINNPDENAE